MSQRSSRAQGAYAARDSDLSRAAHQSTELAEMAAGKSEFLHGNPPSLDFLEAPLTAGLIGSMVCVIMSSSMPSIGSGVFHSTWYTGLVTISTALLLAIWIGNRLQNDFGEFERLRERWEVDNFPDGEVQEMIQIYLSYGLSDTDASSVAKTLSKYKDFWVDHMLLHEIGIIPSDVRTKRNKSLSDAAHSFVIYFVSFILPSYAISFNYSPFEAWVISFLQTFTFVILKNHSCQWMTKRTSTIILLVSAVVSGVISKISEYVYLFAYTNCIKS